MLENSGASSDRPAALPLPFVLYLHWDQNIVPRLGRLAERRPRWFALVALWGLAVTVGCQRSTDRTVVVYAALDQEFSEPVLDGFGETAGIEPRAVYDIESTKTVGLYNRIVFEANAPRCDVFWNNEILHTIRLARAGLLAPYESPAAADIPANYRSRDGLWTGFAARARVLLVNLERTADERPPASVRELADPRWQGRTGLARPLFGTTATHAAVLFAKWGEGPAREFFQQVRDKAVVFSGNKQVAEAVSRGQLAWGLTDTDDALVELSRGAKVAIVFPDQQPDEEGTLFIPNTLSLLKDCPHPDEARALIDYVLAPAVERRLADGPSAQFPLHPEEAPPDALPAAAGVRRMDVDFEAAADQWDAASSFLYELFAQ